jgi:hypothetical protein
MGNFYLRKYIREALEEYGNMAFQKVNAYPPDHNKFPTLDPDHPNDPADIDFLNDLKFQDDNLEEEEDLKESE